jgi:molybdopterin converting factor small subunit
MGEPGLPEVQVAVHVFGLLRMRTGRARIHARVGAGTTLEGLFRHLAAEYDEGFLDAVVRRPGEPADTRHPTINLVILNGRTLRLPRDLQLELEMGDELYLIPPIAGG